MSWRARISTNLKELIITHSSKAESSESAGVRNYFQKNYNNLKHLNPGFPFLVRTGEAHPAKFVATYDFGATTERDLTNLSEKDVEQTLKELVQIGQVALKADMYYNQESAPADIDVVDFAEIKRRR